MSDNQAAAPAGPHGRGKALHDTLHGAVEYAPVWVRMLSAVCLGLGTMIGYRRIVTTIGERIGKRHLSPAQGASAELVGAALIGTAGFSGLPVSTTHIIASGVAGTMAGSGAGVQKSGDLADRDCLGGDAAGDDRAVGRAVLAAVRRLMPASNIVQCGIHYSPALD